MKLPTKYIKLGVLLGLLLTFWLLEVAIASAAPLSCQTAIHIFQMGWQQAGTIAGVTETHTLCHQKQAALGIFQGILDYKFG
jgi:hypothetical protein